MVKGPAGGTWLSHPRIKLTLTGPRIKLVTPRGGYEGTPEGLSYLIGSKLACRSPPPRAARIRWVGFNLLRLPYKRVTHVYLLSWLLPQAASWAVGYNGYQFYMARSPQFAEDRSPTLCPRFVTSYLRPTSGRCWLAVGTLCRSFS